MASPTDHSTLINSLAATTTIMETFAKSLQTKDEQVDALPKGVQDKDAQIEALVQANQAKDVQLDALIKAIQAKEHKADFGGMRDQILANVFVLWPMVRLSDIVNRYDSPVPDFRVVICGKGIWFRAAVVHGASMGPTKHPFIEGNHAKSAEEAIRTLLQASMSLLEYYREPFLMLDEDNNDDQQKTIEGGSWYGPEEA